MSHDEMHNLILYYWNLGDRESAFGVYFMQVPDWQIYAHRLDLVLPKLESINNPQEFKMLLKEMICG